MFSVSNRALGLRTLVDSMARPLTNGLYKVTDNGKPTLLVALANSYASYGQFIGTDKEQ